MPRFPAPRVSLPLVCLMATLACGRAPAPAPAAVRDVPADVTAGPTPAAPPAAPPAPSPPAPSPAPTAPTPSPATATTAPTAAPAADAAAAAAPASSSSLSSGSTAAGHADPPAIARWIHRSADDKPLPFLFGAEITAARAERREVIVMFTADWCAPCKAIKEFVRESAVVQRSLARGRFLYIDVDEWRGPAHALIPGINPTKLPTLVRVDGSGRSVVTCYGSDLGLLSEDAVATNVGHLLAGKPPQPPFYADKPEVERELIRKQSEAQSARTAGRPELEVRLLRADAKGAQLQLILRNHDGPRRWYAIAEGKSPLSEAPSVRAWQSVRWGEHVRADFVRLVPAAAGATPIAVVPVAGFGSVELHGWPVAGRWRKGDLVEVWELNRLGLDDQSHQFQMKLPYHLKIAQAQVQAVAAEHAAAKAELAVKRKLQAVIP